MDSFCGGDDEKLMNFHHAVKLSMKWIFMIIDIKNDAFMDKVHNYFPNFIAD